MGGHMSRSHPGASELYTKKAEIREARAVHRELHNEAKKEYLI
jgi:hypothetical protein